MDLSSAPEAQQRSFGLPNRSLVFDTPSSLDGPRDQDHTPGRAPSTAETPAPLHHKNLTSTIRHLKRSHPFLFLEPSRQAVFSIKSMPRMRLDWDRSTGECTVRKSTRRGDVDGTTTSSANTLPNLSSEKKTQLSTALDLECRINQFVYHKSSFAIDSVLKVFADYELTARDFVQLRASASAYHSDFQSKFLWKGLYPWCEAFATEKAQVTELVKYDLTEPARNIAFKKLMEPCLTKSTYESCWHFIAGICPWEYNFADNSSASLQFYFLKANFITMTALMFKLISAEEELNRGLPVTAVPRKDRTMRETIRQVYQDLAYNPRFVDVDRSIFQFEDQVRVRRRTLAPVDYMLDHYLLVADEPPPLPAGLKVSRTPIPPFFPPASDASGSDSRGQKRRHPGGLSGQNAPHPNPHPSRRSSNQRRAPAPSHSSLGLSGDDDDENVFASSSRWQRGSNHRSQQPSQQGSGHTSRRSSHGDLQFHSDGDDNDENDSPSSHQCLGSIPFSRSLRHSLRRR
jgi:hypothetical protein